MRTEKTLAETYIEKVFVRENEERKAILKDLITNNKNGIQVSPTEGQLLKFFAQMISAKKIVEIGTLFGYSTSWFLESLEQASTSERSKVWSFEKDEFNFVTAKKHLSKHLESNRLEILFGDASTNLNSITNQGPFDLIFIDANKSGYLDYFHWADQNLKSGGLIIADNTFLLGLVFSDQEPSNHKKAWQVMSEFNSMMAQHPNYVSTLIPTHEGLTVAFKNS